MKTQKTEKKTPVKKIERLDRVILKAHKEAHRLYRGGEVLTVMDLLKDAL